MQNTRWHFQIIKDQGPGTEQGLEANFQCISNQGKKSNIKIKYIINSNQGQAGAELCQAQHSLS